MKHFSLCAGLWIIASAGAAYSGLINDAALSSRAKRIYIHRAEAFSEVKLQRREPVSGSPGARSQGQSSISRPEAARSRSQSPSVPKSQDYLSSPKPIQPKSATSQQRSQSKPSSPKIPKISHSPVTSKPTSPQHSHAKSQPQAIPEIPHSPITSESKEASRRDRPASSDLMSPTARQRLSSPEAQSPRAQSPQSSSESQSQSHSQSQSQSQSQSRSQSPLFVGEQLRLSDQRLLPPVRLSSGALNNLNSRLQQNQQAREQQAYAQIQTQARAQGQAHLPQVMGAPVSPSQLPGAMGIPIPPALAQAQVQANQAQRASPPHSPSTSSGSDQSERSGGLRSVGNSRKSSPSVGN